MNTHPGLEKLAAGFSVGVELPLDNDWLPEHEQARVAAGRLPGEPDMRDHAALARLADSLGYRAIWIRDVPLYDPGFGDAAQVFEVFSYLGYLAAHTRQILLGTAAVVLPLREPVLSMKSAATIDLLSQERLLLGVASGDRPVEYPIFGRDYQGRGESFRSQVSMFRSWKTPYLPEGVHILPAPRHPIPLLAAGLSQQSPEWIGHHMDGCLAYPGSPEDHARRSAAWRANAGGKPYVTFIHLDLDERAHAPLTRHRFGASVGRVGLLAELNALRDVGVHHVGLHFRRNRRPIAECLAEIASFVMPRIQGAPVMAD